MRAGEFVDQVISLGRRRGVPASYDKKSGKGSHGTLRYGILRTTVTDLRKELKTGTLHAMCKQLQIPPGQLREKS